MSRAVITKRILWIYVSKQRNLNYFKHVSICSDSQFDFQLFFLMYSLNEFVIISTMCVDVEMSKNHHEVFCIELYNFDNNGMGKALYMYIGKTFVKVKVKVSV